MTLQICPCGWSKVTTYHGLRTHQGKMGCTPKGMHIPETEQFRFNSNIPKFSLTGPSAKVEKPLFDIFNPIVKSESEQNRWTDLLQESLKINSSPVNITPARAEPFIMSLSQTLSSPATPAVNKSLFESPPPLQGLSLQTGTTARRALDFSTGAEQIIATPDMTLQICPCGWSKVTTYHGLRTHQGKMGCTPKGMHIPETEQFRFNSNIPKFSLTGPSAKVEKPLFDIFNPIVKSESEQNRWTSLLQESLQINSSPVNITPARAEPFTMSLSQTLSSPATPAVNKSLFESPPPLQGLSLQTGTTARRALDFSTGAEQVGQPVWDLPPPTAPHETVVRPKEKQRDKEREAQKLLQVERQDMIRADFQKKVQMREQKIVEIRSAVKAYNLKLDAEWMEIDNVFSEVKKIVEGARQKALQPLEDRKYKVDEKAQDLVTKLQKEIDQLQAALNELDRNPDYPVSPVIGLDESVDWERVIANSVFTFGTLRNKTSKMMKDIHQKLEKLSSVELKRISAFAVDVKLDPDTAHHCLALSPDLKKVRDGGNSQNLPDSPERFNTFGSILGMNWLTSGRSYWEVEVSNKTGWDLGVARRSANRKGMLKLTPDNGFWVTVHYEDEKYAALSSPPVSISLKDKPKKVGVFVDYEEGLVSFYDVTARSHIYSFTECSFKDGIFPYFSPHLGQNGKNSSPLVISAVTKQEQCL